MEAVMNGTRENFHELVSEGTVLVDVWGPQCRPCMALMPHVEALAAERDTLRVVKLEAPKARRICIDHQIHSLPTFLLLHDGEEIARLSAPTISPTQLNLWLDQHLDRIGKEVS